MAKPPVTTADIDALRQQAFEAREAALELISRISTIDKAPPPGHENYHLYLLLESIHTQLFQLDVTARFARKEASDDAR